MDRGGQYADAERKVFLGNLSNLSRNEILYWLDGRGWVILPGDRELFYMVPKGDLANVVRASGTVVGLRLELNKTSEEGRAAAGGGQFPGLPHR